jgi:hypothetical protein
MSDITVSGRIGEAVLGLLASTPSTREVRSETPRAAARSVANHAAARAALAAGSLALPPGPLGWLTLLPELITVWRIQAQMVADIAALYGSAHAPSREEMLYCLFRHTAAQAVRDLGVRLGERLVRQASAQLLQKVAEQIGIKLSQRALGKGLARWLPIVGAMGVGAYAWYDTGQVAATAIELFESTAGAARPPAGEVVSEG